MVGVLSFACDETQPSESNIGPHASIAFVSSIASLDCCLGGATNSSFAAILKTKKAQEPKRLTG